MRAGSPSAHVADVKGLERSWRTPEARTHTYKSEVYTVNNNTALTMKVFNYKDKEAMMKTASKVLSGPLE